MSHGDMRLPFLTFEDAPSFDIYLEYERLHDQVSIAQGDRSIQIPGHLWNEFIFELQMFEFAPPTRKAKKPRKGKK